MAAAPASAAAAAAGAKAEGAEGVLPTPMREQEHLLQDGDAGTSRRHSLSPKNDDVSKWERWPSVVLDVGRGYVRGALVARAEDVVVMSGSSKTDAELDAWLQELRETPAQAACSSVARLQHRGCMIGMNWKDRYTTQDEWAVTGVYHPVRRLTRPVAGGTFVDWDDMEAVLHHVFYNRIRIAPEEWGCVVSLPAAAVREHKSIAAGFTKRDDYDTKSPLHKMTMLLHETFSSDATAFVPRPAAVASYLGLTNALLVDVGADSTSVVLIDAEGNVDYDSLAVAPTCGVEQTGDVLQERMKGPDGSDAISLGDSAFRGMLGELKVREMFQDMAAAHGVCRPSSSSSDDGDDDDEELAPEIRVAPPTIYKLPDDATREVLLSPALRLGCVEEVFWPPKQKEGEGAEDPVVGKNAPGRQARASAHPRELAYAWEMPRGTTTLADVVLQAAEGNPATLRNVYLIGGGARIPGLGMRLQNELRAHESGARDAVVTVPEEPELVSYRSLMHAAHRLHDVVRTPEDTVPKAEWPEEPTPGRAAGWLQRQIYDEYGPSNQRFVDLNTLTLGRVGVKAARA